MSNASSNRTWRMPLVLAACSVVGLLSALLGNGLWDTLSWLALGLPVAVVLRFAKPRARPD